MSQDPDPIKVVAHCILDVAIDKALSYYVPQKLQGKIHEGLRVLVPIKNQIQKATILSYEKNTSKDNLSYIKDILDNEPKIQKDVWPLALWIAEYYIAPFYKVFPLFSPPSLRDKVKEKSKIFVELALPKKKIGEEISRLRHTFPMQALVLELLLKQKKGIFLSDLLDEMKISRSPIDTLTKKKFLSQKNQTVDRSSFLQNQPFFSSKPKKLNEEQQTCFQDILKTVQEAIFQVHLIYGITGSGKTEIYMQLMQKVLEENKSVIFQVPEVALTSPFIEKFKARFDQKIAVIHHKLSQGERFDAWKNIEEKRCLLVIGARSAIFTPCKDLGLIIIDEEHDSSYKQTEKAPTYHAKDVAIMRAKLNNCPIVLGSATPSFESFTHAKNNKYKLHTLTKRAQGSIAPVKIVDMKTECQKQGRFTYFSQDLLERIKDRQEKGEQTLLFLNRRGYHTSVLCKSCSWIYSCPHCELALTYYKKREMLSCHLCGYKAKPTKTCQNCKSSEQIQYKGFGTEQVERALYAILPQLKILRLDRDTVQRKHSHEELLKQFRSGKADVLIGTQMIAKGLHFPSCTLVGIISIDGQLQIPDFRASETVFQLITQVAGRAGRAALKGEVVLQTFLPQNETIKLASSQDYLQFYEKEIAMRKLCQYPPFCRMGKLILSGKNPEDIVQAANTYLQVLRKNLPTNYQISPLAPCGYAKVKDLYRFQFFIKGPSSVTISKAIKQAVKTKNTKVTTLVDIDPLFTYF